MGIRSVFVASVLALGLPSTVLASDTSVAIELMKLNVAGNPPITESRTLARGATLVYELTSPGIPLVLDVKATWAVAGLPGVSTPLEMTLESQTGAVVSSGKGGSPLVVSGQINPSNLKFRIRVKNTGSFGVSLLKLSIGGRAGVVRVIDGTKRTPVGGG